MAAEQGERRHPEYQYLDLLQDVMENGKDKGSLSSGERLRFVFGRIAHYDLEEGFPLLTTKRVYWHGVKEELLWFLSGDTNIRRLVQNNVHIWDGDAYKKYLQRVRRGEASEMPKDEYVQRIEEDEEFAMRFGELGPVYGRQWRRFPSPDGREVDQLAWVIEGLKKAPSRKHYVVNAWNPAFIYEMAPSEEEEMALPPCHMMMQFDVDDEGRLSMEMVQRSCDMFLGVPFNIASYSLLLEMVAQVTNLKPGTFVHNTVNTHIYHAHFAQVREQLSREPRPFPKLVLNTEIRDIDKFTSKDIDIEGYNPHRIITAPLITVGGRTETIAQSPKP